MPKRQPQKNTSNLESIFLFFATVVIFSFIFIFYITIKNECLSLQGEIYHIDNNRLAIRDRVRVLESNTHKLTQRNHVEKEARNRFGMIFPDPESLIVYVGLE